MSIFIMFLPWIVQGALSSYSLPLALGLSLLISLYSLLKSRYILEWVTCIFFTCSFILALFLQNEYVHTTISILASITLSLIAWLSLSVGKPFTLHYAKERVPQHQWSSPIFLQINRVMTMLFGIIFSSEVVLKIMKLLYPTLLPYTWFSYFFLLCILLLITRFPTWYKKRLLKKQ